MVPVVRVGGLDDVRAVAPVAGVRQDGVGLDERLHVAQILADALGVEEDGSQIGQQQVVREEEVVLGRAGHRDDLAVEVVAVGAKERPGEAVGLAQLRVRDLEVALVAHVAPDAVLVGSSTCSAHVATARCRTSLGLALAARPDELGDDERVARREVSCVRNAAAAPAWPLGRLGAAPTLATNSATESVSAASNEATKAEPSIDVGRPGRLRASRRCARCGASSPAGCRPRMRVRGPSGSPAPAASRRSGRSSAKRYSSAAS